MIIYIEHNRDPIRVTTVKPGDEVDISESWFYHESCTRSSQTGSIWTGIELDSIPNDVWILSVVETDHGGDPSDTYRQYLFLDKTDALNMATEYFDDHDFDDDRDRDRIRQAMLNEIDKEGYGRVDPESDSSPSFSLHNLVVEK